ncbi:MAG: phage adaptor protein [Chloroflexota bacterium]
MNLTEMRARVRQDLQDTDSQNYRWTDAQVDAAINRVVLEYSLHAPIEQQTDIATTDGNTELDISGLSGLLQIQSVEFPTGQTPKRLQRFERWAGRLYMHDEGDGTDARVRWLKQHTLTTDSTTIPTEHEEIVVLGATAHLAMSASVATVDKATIGGRYTTSAYRSWAWARFRDYQSRLRAVSRTTRIIPKELYTEDPEP